MLSNCQRQAKIFKVISKTQTPGIPQHTWNIPVKQTRFRICGCISCLSFLSPCNVSSHLSQVCSLDLRRERFCSVVSLELPLSKSSRSVLVLTSHTAMGLTHFWHQGTDSAIMESSLWGKSLPPSSCFLPCPAAHSKMCWNVKECKRMRTYNEKRHLVILCFSFVTRCVEADTYSE